MSLTAFPEPPDLKLSYELTITDGKNINMSQWSVENPHPGYGKDPNILNEFGHTKYPMFVGSVIVHNEEEELAAKGEVKLAEVPPVAWNVVAPVLRDDGPTVQEWMDHGYKAEAYPPKGYASKSTDEEINAAIAEQAKPQGWV